MSKRYLSDLNTTKNIMEFKDDFIFDNCVFNGTLINFDSDMIVLSNCYFANNVRFRFTTNRKNVLVLNDPIIENNTQINVLSGEFDLRNGKGQVNELIINAENIDLINSNIHKLKIDSNSKLKILACNIVTLETLYDINATIENSYIGNNYYGDKYNFQNTIKKSSQS